MAHSRGSGFRTTRGQRRKTAWEIGTQTGTDGSAQSITTSSSTVATGAFTIALDGITLIRTRGELLLIQKSANVAGAGFSGAFGIAVANSAAITAGVASLPTPITEEAWDGWLYHRYFTMASGGVVDGGAAQDELAVIGMNLRLEVDSKAMRKLEVDQGVYAVLEVIEAGTSTMDWYFNSRSLIKLP